MRIRKAIYSFAKRLFVLDVTHLLFTERRVPFHPGKFTFGLLTESDLLGYSLDHSLCLDPDMSERLGRGTDFCFVAKSQDRVAGYCWVALRGIESEHNRGDHPLSGVAISFPENTAFIYKAFTSEKFRGQRVFPRLLGYAAQELRPRGVTKIVSTTDWTNEPALSAFRRSGFEQLGLIWKVCKFNVGFTRAPEIAKRFQLRIGKLAQVATR